MIPSMKAESLSCEGRRWRMFMHVDDDTGKTTGQYGQTTIQGRKATFHTTCVAQRCEDQ